MVPVVGTVLSVVVINRCLSADDIAGLMRGTLGLGHFLGRRDSAKVELYFACVPSETDEQAAWATLWHGGGKSKLATVNVHIDS